METLEAEDVPLPAVARLVPTTPASSSATGSDVTEQSDAWCSCSALAPSAATASATGTSFTDKVTEQPVSLEFQSVVVGNEPNQPTDPAVYPAQNTSQLTKEGKPKVRYMNTNWYEQNQWLHWDDMSEKLYCFFCLHAKQRNLLLSDRYLYEPTFIESGFSDWKNAARAFERHAKCDCHREAVDNWESISRISVSAQLNTQLLRDQRVASKALSTILTSVQYLARQGLSLRGHTEQSGNPYQVLLTRSRDISELETFHRGETTIFLTMSKMKCWK